MGGAEWRQGLIRTPSIIQREEPGVWGQMVGALEKERRETGLGDMRATQEDRRVRERCVSRCLLGFWPGYLGWGGIPRA